MKKLTIDSSQMKPNSKQQKLILSLLKSTVEEESHDSASHL